MSFLSWDTTEELECKALLLGMRLFEYKVHTDANIEYCVVDSTGTEWFFDYIPQSPEQPYRKFYKDKREALKEAIEMFSNGTPRTSQDD